MKLVEVELDGASALLINRFKEQDEITQKMKKSGKTNYGTPREQAEATAYSEPTGVLWIPSTWIKGALATIASDYKLPSSRKSVKSVIGGAVIPRDEKIYFKENYTIKDIEVDSRPCVIQRARIMRHRARLEKWSIQFHLEIFDDILELSNVNEMLCDAGRRSGIGDFRPSKGGPFGRFNLIKWNVISD